MKKFKYIMVLAVSFAVVFACTDDTLDPLQFSNMKKGTIIALRGTQLNNLYNLGIAGASIVPQAGFTGTEKFDFDAEFLSSDKASLASVDVYVLKGSGASATRVLIQNVPFSQFKNDGKYLGPWVSISLTLPNVLTALGLPAFSDPVYLTDPPTNPLLTTYKNGILFECDLNLTNGTKILAADIVAAGLFQSNQFYPAMKLTWTVLRYCSYNASKWAGNWIATEVPGSVDANKLTQDLVDPNKFEMDNWWGDGVTAYIIFTPSTNLTNQIVTLPAQATADPGNIDLATGTYDQCKETFSIKCTYRAFGGVYVFVYNWAKDI